MKRKNNTRPGGSVGGPSGKHTTAKRNMRMSEHAFALADQAAKLDGESWSDWVRALQANAVAAQLGLDPEETAAVFES